MCACVCVWYVHVMCACVCACVCVLELTNERISRLSHDLVRVSDVVYCLHEQEVGEP